MSSVTSTPRRVQCRELMKRNYHENDGKRKTLLKYYKYKYRSDETITEIINNKDLTIGDKLKKIQEYRFQKKMEAI